MAMAMAMMMMRMMMRGKGNRWSIECKCRSHTRRVCQVYKYSVMGGTRVEERASRQVIEEMR